jgi:hypothetical protein
MNEAEQVEEPVAVQEPVEELVGELEEELVEEPPPPPQRLKRAPRKAKAAAVAPPPERPVLVLSASFWGEMVQTRREMESEARSARFANLVRF